ncbi:toxin-antitoxin system, toxin component, RelE family [Parasutterella excrementihominis YIT 11859]|uniref:Toxin-antitoxin system, toxin component, RelE family n=1 Tax=Parasutterella excrementihominis YIT 11859 TaxID=762966 RepID=F3QNU5_9BURK|nr:type II toxin-antitoxin system RelE/ParE family toxin [Parasutterella excrementihominis]EGG50646.1 toxin-antitoxin system, toxin component, RelE family [Parasutterella excrementihominis YIT 11859]
MPRYEIYFFSEDVRLGIEAMPLKIRARLKYLLDKMEVFGSDLGEPHTKTLTGYPGLFEVRAKAAGGNGRVFYCTKVGREIWLLHSIIKKTQKTPKGDLEIAYNRLKELKSGN